MKAKREPTKQQLALFFEPTETCFKHDGRVFHGGFLWRPATWRARPAVLGRVRKHGVAFAGGYYRHPRSGVEYACIGTKWGYYLTHRLVWVWHHGPIPLGMIVDHIDRNTFNNTLENLRLLDGRGNHKNRGAHKCSSSRFVGVHWEKGKGKWVASYRLNGKAKKLGSFTVESQAAIARDRAVHTAYSGLANYNFPGLLSTEVPYAPTE